MGIIRIASQEVIWQLDHLPRSTSRTKTGLSAINRPTAHHGRVNNGRRQAVGNLVHLSRDTGAEITIPTVMHAPTDVRS
jgi:hypothetical protein